VGHRARRDCSGLCLGASAVLLAGLIGGGVYFWSTSRGDSGPYRIVTAGEKLNGWPHVDECPKNVEEEYLSYVCVAGEVDSHVRVDAAGIHAPVQRQRSVCGDHPCAAIPPRRPARSRRSAKRPPRSASAPTTALTSPMPTGVTATRARVPPTCSFAGALKTARSIPPGATGTVRYGRGSGAAESGELDVLVPSAALHNVVSDAECAAGEKLSHK
jgi:hypothetical protein